MTASPRTKKTLLPVSDSAWFVQIVPNRSATHHSTTSALNLTVEWFMTQYESYSESPLTVSDEYHNVDIGKNSSRSSPKPGTPHQPAAFMET
jgi:hypothetical protein